MSTRTLSLLLVTAALLPACGGADDDLKVAVADDAHGAAISAVEPAPQAVPQPAPQAVPQPAPQAVPQPAPEAAPQPAPRPDATPGVVTATATATVSIGAATSPEPEDMTLGDMPTPADEPVREPVSEPAAEPASEPATAADTAEAPEEDAATGDDWPGEEPDPPKLVEGVWQTHFDYLGSFDAGVDALPPGSALAQHTPVMPEKEGAKPREKGIPEAVTKMNGQKVRIEGYMIPLEFDEGHVKTFFLSRYMMGCCFGVLPRANEVIEVTMVEGAKAYYDAYMPFIVTGTFEVVEGGTDPEFLQSVFRIQGDTCEYSEDW